MSVRVRYALMGAAVLAASVSPVVCQTGGSGGRAAVYAFENVMVLPMDRAGAIAGQTVLVRDGTIAAVGDAGDVRIPPEATVIEGAGRYLMPGLAEMHAHVPPQQNPPRDVLEDIFFLYIANGVTTIRGMLGRSYQIALADELERGEILGPTFYVGAPSLNGNSAPDPETAERLVRRHKSEGYDLQKIHPGLSRATWNHMAATAREVGLTFAGHVPQAVGLSHALETGLSTVDHLDGYVVAVASDAVGARAEAGEQVGLADIVDAVDEAKVSPSSSRASSGTCTSSPRCTCGRTYTANPMRTRSSPNPRCATSRGPKGTDGGGRPPTVRPCRPTPSRSTTRCASAF